MLKMGLVQYSAKEFDWGWLICTVEYSLVCLEIGKTEDKTKDYGLFVALCQKCKTWAVIWPKCGFEFECRI